MSTLPPGTDPHPDGAPAPHTFANLYQIIGRALTQYKGVETVTRNMPARDAIRLLRERHFSQVPVVGGGGACDRLVLVPVVRAGGGRRL